MKTCKENLMKCYNEVKEKGEFLNQTKGIKIEKEKYSYNGWYYTFYFCCGELKKLEETNHRELIECWVDI